MRNQPLPWGTGTKETELQVKQLTTVIAELQTFQVPTTLKTVFTTTDPLDKEATCPLPIGTNLSCPKLGLDMLRMRMQRNMV